jgi:hypothetical protein
MDEDRTGQQTFGGRRFLRLILIFWGVAAGAILIAAAFAPYAARVTDAVLHWTSHRHWHALHLETARPFFDLATPVAVVKSYYSALYREDYGRLEHLTHGLFRDQIRQRQEHRKDVTPASAMTYQSFVFVQKQSADAAVVVEKFHLFWHQGLRFSMQRQSDRWSIGALELLP